MEPARCEKYSAGQRRSPATPGDDTLLSLNQEFLYAFHRQQLGEHNSVRPGRYRPARCGSPTRIGWLLLCHSSSSQSVTRAAPRGKDDVLPHPGMKGSHPQIICFSAHFQSRQAGDENKRRSSRHNPARCGNRNPTGWFSRGLIEPFDLSPSPDKKHFRTSTAPTTLGRRQAYPRSISL